MSSSQCAEHEGEAMRISKQQATANRERILAEAARLFRERGLAGVGVDALAEAAGMTHGALYSQFGSKERLAAEALNHALENSAARAGQAATLTELAAGYLSERHRDAPGRGCAIAALGAEMPRHGGTMRHNFTEGLRRMVARVAALLPAAQAEARQAAAMAHVATLVGALVLARAVDDPDLSARILAAARGRVTDAGDPGR